MNFVLNLEIRRFGQVEYIHHRADQGAVHENDEVSKVRLWLTTDFEGENTYYAMCIDETGYCRTLRSGSGHFR
jgi:hypothetical protein